MKHIIFNWNSLLAAEFVIGTLPSRSRQRYQTYLNLYPELRTMVTLWQNDLTALSEALPAIEPDADLWAAIRTQI